MFSLIDFPTIYYRVFMHESLKRCIIRENLYASFDFHQTIYE